MKKVAENPSKNRIDHPMALVVIACIFTSLYLISNLMAVKVVSFFHLFYFDAGTFTFPFAYMLGDVLTEIWGFKTAKKVIWITFFCNVILVLFSAFGVWLPYPDYMQETADAYRHIYTYVPRIVAGSLVGFLLGELSNAWTMEWIKRKTKGNHLWMRTIGSSVVGYIFDSVPFVLIGFAFTVPLRDLLLMVALQFFLKLLIEAFLGTPMAYVVIGRLKRKIGK